MPEDSDLARQLGVEGYYVRIAPPDSDCAASPLEGFVPIKNRPAGEEQRSRRPPGQPGLAGIWCALACARPTIRGS